MKMSRKVADILELITATIPKCTATGQHAFYSTKFNLSVQGWIFNFSLKPVLKAWTLIYE